MAIKILLTSEKNFYKGNMHAHTTLSDGKQTPEEVKELYKANGYSFVAFTDHEVIFDNSHLDDDEFIALTGVEYAIKEFPDQSTMKNLLMKVCHLNLYAKDQHNTNCVCYSAKFDHHTSPEVHEEAIKKFGDYERVYTPEAINEIIRIANENGFLVQYNHPIWCLDTYDFYSKYEGLWGVEVFNYGTSRSDGISYDIHVLDDFLRLGKKVFATAGDDNHSVASSLGGFVYVNAESLTYENIINALEKGDFYTSQGPQIFDMWYEDGKLTVKSSDARKIIFQTAGRRHGSKHALPGEHINEAVFEIRDEDVYFRIEVVDEHGYTANSQAYFIEDLKK